MNIREVLKESKLKENGITLIALVISIIVMLILAGVSLNAVIGDNGIITQAQNATYMQSIAVLEEYLNTFYVEHYDEFNDKENKIQAMTKFNVSKNWFYQPMTGLGYITDSEGNIHYFINKAGLPEEIRSQLKGGDAGEGTYADYARMNDVYGVTTDLKVYYCSDGSDTKLGAEESVRDNPNREVFNSSNSWSNYLKEKFPDIIKTDEEGNILLENLNVIQELDLDGNEDSNLDFSELYNFTSLKRINLYNYNNKSLNGFENLAMLDYLYIENCDLTDYSAINNLSTLTHLYLIKSNDENVERLSNALANSNLPNLQYFGIMNKLYDKSLYNLTPSGVSNVTDISSLSKISETTKNAVKYLWLSENQINSIEGISDFKNVYQLVIMGNPNLQNLNGTQQMTGLKYVYAQSCSNLQNIEGLINSNQLVLLTIQNNNKITSLNGIQNATNLQSLYAYSCNIQDIMALEGKTKLNYLNLNSNTNLENVIALKDDTRIRELHLAGNNNMLVTDIRQLSSIIANCTVIELPSKYYAVLEGSTRREYRNMGLTDSSDEILALEGDTTCEELSLEGNSNLGATEAGKEKLIEILGSMTNLKALQLKGLKNLDSLEWIKSMPNLVELDLRGTAITDLSLLNTYGTKIETLVIDNSNIELTTIQNFINELGDSGYSKTLLTKSNNQAVQGLQITSQELANKLANCTEFTKFNILPLDATAYITYDLSNCLKMTDFNEKNCSYIKFILPANVEKVYFSYSMVEPDLNLCNNIVSFTYSDPRNLTNDDLEVMLEILGNCFNLKSVDVSTLHSVTKLEGIENLSNTKIENLYVGGGYNRGWESPISAPLVNIDGIGELKTLKTLNMSYTKVPNLNALEGCINLETLSAMYGQINDISGIANCTNLKILDFSGNSTIQHSSIYDLKPLTNLTKLEQINLYYNSVSNLTGLENLVNLTTLTLSNNAITNTVVTENGVVNNLQILADLNKNKLRKLYLSNNKIDDFTILKNITNWEDKSGW